MRCLDSWITSKEVKMSFFSGLLKAFGTSGGSTAASLAGNYLSNELIGKPNAERAKEWAENASAVAFERSYDAYRRRYQDTTADMIKAGINPIMAASGGFSVGQSPNMTPPQVFPIQPPNIDVGSTAKNIADAIKTSGVDTELTETEIRKKRQDIKESWERVYNLRVTRGLVRQQEKTEFERTKTLENQFALLREQIDKTQREIKLLNRQTDKTREEYELLKNKRKLIQGQTAEINIKVKALREQIKKMIKINKVYENPGGQLLAYIEQISKSLPSLIRITK